MKEGDPILITNGHYKGQTGRVMDWSKKYQVLTVKLRSGTEFTTFDTSYDSVTDQFIAITEEEYETDEVLTK